MNLRSMDRSKSRFAAYVEGLVSVIGHADRASPLRDYYLGLIMPCERKSVEPMAAITAPDRTAAQHQSLLHFVGQSPWSKTKSPQTHGIAERFHKTVLDEFYRIAFRKKLYASIEELQNDLDLWIKSYNEERPHQGGKPPMQTFLDAIPIAREKMIAA